MAKTKIENLMTELHAHFGAFEASPEQERLLENLRQGLYSDDQKDGLSLSTASPIETVDFLLQDMGKNHPNVTSLLRELLDTLKNIGV